MDQLADLVEGITVEPTALLDIALTALLIYGLFSLIQGTRAVRLVTSMAIAQQPKLDIRLWMLFWELADRYGRVHRDGVHVDLPLTHELLSQLAGARRQSVSSALTRLVRRGVIERHGSGWVLHGEPS